MMAPQSISIVDSSPDAASVYFRSRSFLAHRGERPRALWLIEEGWASGYKVLRDGRRHISRFYMPGDLCDPSWLAADEVDQLVVSITPIKAIPLDRSQMETRLQSDPAFSGRLAFEGFARLRAQSEWLVTLGCKSATERLSQLICELFCRLAANGRVEGDRCDFPLSQQDMADFTGMTPVHVCRTLKELRTSRLIELRRRRLRILDFERLAKLCGFDGAYIEAETTAVPRRLAAAA
jgi:CRP-like cAMP-binding protein